MENTNIDLKETIAKNIIKYRKTWGYTQAELADILNYSDKTLSKWERAESIPDVITLKQMADLFEVSVDVLLSDEDAPVPEEIKVKGESRKNRTIIAFGILSQVIALSVATLVFTMLTIGGINGTYIHPWICFIYALPIMFVVMLVFSCIWGTRVHLFITTSGLIWTLALAIHLSLFKLLSYMYLVYVVAIPFQVITFICYFLIKKKKVKKED